MDRDPVYRTLRANVQALLDRDAPRTCVLIEVDWHPDSGKVVCVAREDIDGAYNVWSVGFSEARPSSLNDGEYAVGSLAAAGESVNRRLYR